MIAQRELLKTFNHQKEHRQVFSTNKLKLSYQGLIQDISYQSRKIGVKDQWAARIAEDIVKSYQIDRTNRGMQAVDDTNVAAEIHAYFLFCCKTIPEQLTWVDFDEGICKSLGLCQDPSPIHIPLEMEKFWTFSKHDTLMDERLFQTNSIDIDKLSRPTYISLQHMVNGFEFLSRKSIRLMYQEILDHFYIISKRMGMHISGPTIANLFEEDDPHDNFEVSAEMFANRLFKFLIQHDSYKTESQQVKLMHNLQFLATKYLKESDSLQTMEGRYISYLDFIQDYGTIENPSDLPGLQREAAIQSADMLKHRAKRDLSLQ